MRRGEKGLRGRGLCTSLPFTSSPFLLFSSSKWLFYQFFRFPYSIPYIVERLGDRLKISYRILKPEKRRSQAFNLDFGKAYVAGNFVEGSSEVSDDNWAGGVQVEDERVGGEAVIRQEYDVGVVARRRDEEKARAKERFFSFRDDFGQWDPKNQRPELWNLFNGKKHIGEQFRVFPLSNWTEMDVWQYIATENIPIPEIYYTHERDVVKRDGVYLANSPFITVMDGEKVEKKKIRFRTIGDMTCTGAVESNATQIEDIILEVAAARETERGTRADDKRSEAAMEDRKKEGYF